MTDQLQAAYDAACRRHPEFPDALDSIGIILAEELLEVVQAGLKALQAINDHRDDGLPLDEVVTEMRHVLVVSTRALERLDRAKR